MRAFRLTYRSLTLAGLMVFSLFGQTVDRTKPPQTPPVPSYKLPPVSESSLSNGMRIVLVQDSRFPLVTARLNFQAGMKFDPADLPGLAPAVAALLEEGTKTRTSRQISDEIDSLGGSIDGSAGADALTLSGEALSENLPRLLALMADLARNATFPQSEVDLYKQNRVQSLKAEHSDPGFLAGEKMASLLYGGSPYAHIAATEASIGKLDVPTMVRFRDAYLVPNNATLLLVGKLPAAGEVRKVVEQEFGSWQRKTLPAEAKMDFPAAKRQIVLVDRPGSVQADIHAGRLAPVRTSPDYFPLMLGSAILGGGANSRMFKDIRERDGFAYDAHSQYTTERGAGDFQAVTEVRNEVLEPALKAVFAELDGMAAAPAPENELHAIQNRIAGLYLLRLETQEGVIAQLNSMNTLGLPNSFLENYVSRVRAVEPAQIQAAARKYMESADDTVVVVGDASKIGDVLRKFGTVEVVK